MVKTAEHAAFATRSFSSFPISSGEFMSLDKQKGTQRNQSVRTPAHQRETIVSVYVETFWWFTALELSWDLNMLRSSTADLHRQWVQNSTVIIR